MKDDAIHVTPEPFRCPACEAALTAVTDVQNAQPLQKGNILICSFCGTVGKIGDGTGLVRVTKEEIAEMDQQSRSMIMMTVASIMSRIAKQRRMAHAKKR
jgi:hypothetical protein